MVTISILANTVRPSVDNKSDDTSFGAGTFSWQDRVHSCKAGPGQVLTVDFFFSFIPGRLVKVLAIHGLQTGKKGINQTYLKYFQ